MANELKTVAATISASLEVAKSISRTVIEIAIGDAQLLTDFFNDLQANSVAEQLTGELEDAEGELATAVSIIEGLESDLTDLRGRTSDATDTVNEIAENVQARIEELEADCKGHIARVEKRDDTIAELETECVRLQDIIEAEAAKKNSKTTE